MIKQKFYDEEYPNLFFDSMEELERIMPFLEKAKKNGYDEGYNQRSNAYEEGYSVGFNDGRFTAIYLSNGDGLEAGSDPTLMKIK